MVMPTKQIRKHRSVIILGNGPTLKGFDFSKFDKFDVFGMNAAYRYWDKINWYPDYYACLDLVVGLSHATDIRRLVNNAHEYGINAFLLRDNLIALLGDIDNLDRVVSFESVRKKSRALSAEPISTGSHSTAWAMHLGYKNIFLMGVDCKYVEVVQGAELVEDTKLKIVSNQENPNYFFDDYQRVGDLYNVPNPNADIHLLSWAEIAKRAQKNGVFIANANAKSNLSIFGFCDFKEIVHGGVTPVVMRDQSAAEIENGRKPVFVQRPFYARGADKLNSISPRLFAVIRKIFRRLR